MSIRNPSTRSIGSFKLKERIRLAGCGTEHVNDFRTSSSSHVNIDGEVSGGNGVEVDLDDGIRVSGNSGRNVGEGEGSNLNPIGGCVGLDVGTSLGDDAVIQSLYREITVTHIGEDDGFGSSTIGLTNNHASERHGIGTDSK